MADFGVVEIGAAETTGLPLEGAEEPAAVATRSEAEEQTVSSDSCLDSGQKLVCQVEAKTVEELAEVATTADAAPQLADSTLESQKSLEPSAEPKVVREPQQVPERATAAATAAEASALEPEAIPPGLPDEDSGAAGLPASETMPKSKDVAAVGMIEAAADNATGVAAETKTEATNEVPIKRKKSCEDTLDEDGSEEGDSTGVGCTTESENTSCTGQTEEDITVRDDSVTHDATAAQAQAASLLVEIASQEMHSTSGPEPEELRVLLLRLSEASTGLERALEELQADSLAIMESNAELHTAIASTLRDLTQTCSGSARTHRDFAAAPEALLGIAKNYWQQVKTGKLNVVTADQGGQSEQAASEQPERPEWVARSQELGRQVRDQFKTLTSTMSVPAGSDSQQQLAKQMADQKQKLQEQLREHWSALATRTSAETGKQVVEKSREIKKQLAEQLNPAHVQQATLQLQSQVLEGYQNLSTRVSQDISEAISKLPWKQDVSAAAAESQTSIEEQAAGILSACDHMDSGSASSAGAMRTTALGVEGLSTETPEDASAGRGKIDENNQLPLMGVLRNHISKGWTLPGRLGLGAPGEAKSASASRNNKSKKGRKAELDGDESFTRVLVELQLQLEEGKVATANLRTSDSRSRVAGKLVHEHKLSPAIKRPLKAILKKAVADAEKYPVEVSVTYAELLHAEGE